MSAVRVQRLRTKGWVMPPNTVSVCRPGKWGNPFSVTTKMKPGSKILAGQYIAVPTTEDAVECYRIWLAENEDGKRVAKEAKEELKGKNLACFCKLDELCHADVLLGVANE